MMKEARYHLDNLARHRVEWFEAEEALHDGWATRRRDGENYEVLGRTSEGRYLQLVVKELPDDVWVLHGRDMTETERRRYRRK